jgi:hypothetical protein
VLIPTYGGFGAAITLSIVYAGAFCGSLGLAYVIEQRRLSQETQQLTIPHPEGIRHAA